MKECLKCAIKHLLSAQDNLNDAIKMGLKPDKYLTEIETILNDLEGEGCSTCQIEVDQDRKSNPPLIEPGPF